MDKITKKSTIRTIALLLIALVIYSIRPVHMNKVLNIDYNKIDQIIITNGDNGDTTSVKDKEKIKDFLKHLDKYYISKDLLQVSTKGYKYAAQLLQNNETKASIVFGRRMHINDKYYYVVNPSFNIREIEKFIQ